jgi:hypothetical protein
MFEIKNTCYFDLTNSSKWHLDEQYPSNPSSSTLPQLRHFCSTLIANADLDSFDFKFTTILSIDSSKDWLNHYYLMEVPSIN